MSVQAALQSISSSLVLVKDFAGQVYAPQYNVDLIGDLQPGQGYKVYVSQPATLLYPSNATVSSSQVAAVRKSLSTGGRPSGLSESAILLFEVPGSSEGDEVLVSTGEGDAVGRGTVEKGRAVVVVKGDDPDTKAVEGAKPGDTFTIQLHSSETGELQELSPSRLRDALNGQELGSELTYANDGFLLVDVEAKPLTFALMQNYPNPFRSTTNISYSLPAKTHVTVEVYNALGQRVSTLVDEAQDAGAHTAILDAVGLASGLYFYRIRAGDFTSTKSMTIVQ